MQMLNTLFLPAFSERARNGGVAFWQQPGAQQALTLSVFITAPFLISDEAEDLAPEAQDAIAQHPGLFDLLSTATRRANHVYTQIGHDFFDDGTFSWEIKFHKDGEFFSVHGRLSLDGTQFRIVTSQRHDWDGSL